MAAATRILLFALSATLVGSSAVHAQARMAVVGVSRTRILDYWTYAVDFTITNTGNVGAYAWVKYSCGPYIYDWDGSCPGGSSGNIGWVSPGGYATASVWVYLGPNVPANGVITQYVTASSDGTLPAGAIWASGNATFSSWTKTATFAPTPLGDYRPVVTPKASVETAPFNTTISRSFVIQNGGTRAATYAIAASCGAMSGCTPSKTMTSSLAPYAIDSVSVSFTTPNTVSTSNTVKLIATYAESNQSIADTGSRPIVTPAVRPTVSPKNGTVIARNGSGVARFFADPSYTLTPLCQGWAANCAFGYRGYDEDTGGWIAEVTFSAPNVLGSATYPSASVKLIGVVGIAADTGVLTAYVGYSKPSISPKTQTITEPAGTARMRSFTVKNTGNAQTMYTTRAVCTGLMNCSIPLAYYQFTLSPGASAAVGTDYVAPPTGVTGTMQLIVSAQPGALGIVEADTATLTVTGADMVAPTLSITGGLPGNGTTTNNGALTVSATACDSDGQLTTPSATINGNPTIASFVAVPPFACATKKDGTFTFVARPGTNTFVASVGDGIHTKTFTSQFVYNELTQVTPVVSAQVASRLLREGVQFTDTFLVRNPGPVPATYSLTPFCGSQLTTCTTPQPSVTVAAGQTAKVPVAYRTVSGPVGTLGVTVRYTGVVSGTTITVNDGVMHVYVDNVAPTIAMTSPVNLTLGQFPTIGFDWCDADGQLATHTVTLDGVALPANYASRSASGCTSAGSSSWPNYAVLLGTHTLVATATDVAGHVSTLTRTFTLSLPAISEFQPQVTPRAATNYLIPAEQTWAFAVRNAGTRSAVYQIAPDCSQIAPQLSASGCQLDRTTLSLAPGVVDTIRLTFTLTGLPASQKTVGLAATYTDIVERTASHTGVVTALIPTMAQLYQPSIAASSGVISVPPSLIRTIQFDVKNQGLARVRYQMGVSVTAPFTLINIRDTITVEPGQTVSYIAQPVAPSTIGTRGTVTVAASYMANGQSVSAMATQVIETKQESPPGIVVEVTPDDLVLPLRAGEVRTYPFVIRNRGASSAFDYTIHCAPFNTGSTSSSVSCADSTGRTTTLGQNDSVVVDARFTGTTSEGDGSVTLQAVSTSDPSKHDGGSIRTRFLAPGRIAVSTRYANSENAIERGGCLTIAAGQAGAYQCGDLRIVHELPATKTMNKTRAPALIYSSRQAQGRALIAADVKVDDGPALSSVRLTLQVRNATGAIKVDTSKTIAWQSGWSDGQLRRFVLGFNAPAVSLLEGGRSAGAFKYTFEVTSFPDNGIARDSGIVIVVDRSSSEFGRGWWLDGVEQLVIMPLDSSRVWVGGDGSARWYKTTSVPNVWTVQPAVDRPDTLVKLFVNGDSVYRRKLRNGAYVEFNSFGQHTKTRNVQGHLTSFTWSGNPSRLRRIALPVPAGSSDSAVYRLTYDGAGQLATVVPPSHTPIATARQVTIVPTSAAGSSAIGRIIDPDTKFVEFKYDAAGRVSQRTSRRLFTTVYGYDFGGTLRADTLKMQGTGGDIVQSFCAAETASVTACAPVMLSSLVRTLYDGPRPTADGDTTAFYVNRFGGLDSIINALGERTRILHTDSRALLATAVIQPNGHRTEAKYDSSAYVVETTDLKPYDRDNAITTYKWVLKNGFTVLDSISAPTREFTKFSYDSNGDREWQQDGRGPTSRVTFRYNANRQVAWFRQPGDVAPGDSTHFEYDARLGNLRRTTSPSGISTVDSTDALGRVIASYLPIDGSRIRTQTFEYDLFDRVLVQNDSGPAVPYSLAGGLVEDITKAVKLLVQSEYDDDGNPLSVRRQSIPNLAQSGVAETRWTYDGAGRKLRQTDQSGRFESWTYNAAGGDTSWTTRRQLTNRTGYDALNRPIFRVTESSTRPSEAGVRHTGDFFSQFPKFPHFAPGFAYDVIRDPGATPPALVLPRDSSAFTYDNLGNIRTAVNRDAIVSRDYWPNGALKSETTKIAVVDSIPGVDRFSQHVYRLEYTYDLSGRRQTRRDSIPGCVGCEQSYGYSSSTGALETVTDAGATFGFGYDDAGRLNRRTTNTNNIVETFHYNSDGWLDHRTLRGQGANAAIYDDQLIYDEAGRVTRATISSDRSGISDVSNSRYNGLGALAAISRTRGGTTPIDEYVTDALGNSAEHRSWVGDVRRRHVSDFVADAIMYSAQVRPAWTPGDPEPDPQLRVVDSVNYGYDESRNVIGNVRLPYKFVGGLSPWDNEPIGREWTWNVYDASERLRVTQRSNHASTGLRTVFTEYRYDALGRRVLTRSRWDQNCTQSVPSDCLSTIDRTVWDGDQILAELRAPGGNDLQGVALEQDPPFGDYMGIVRYTHASGVDEPLAINKIGFSVVVPHRSWRGLYETGSNLDGNELLNVNWPARDRDAFFAPDARVTPLAQTHWLGSIVDGKTDPSGLMYMRNRYYDPKAGRFTQEDPIGLAGGMNLYGFAGGDPVNFSDPFGLCPPQNTICLFSGVWDRFVDRARQFGEGLLDLTPIGDAKRSMDAFSTGRIGAGVGYGVIAGIGFLPGAGEAKVAGKIVIGETAARVGEYAAKIEAEIFIPISKDFIGMMRENAKWLREKIAQGYEVIDIGLDPRRTERGPFYAAEQKIVQRTGVTVTKP